MIPILFNTEMVRAVLEGRKTVTRRVVKEPYYIDDEEWCRVSGLAIHRGTVITDGIPYPDTPYYTGGILYAMKTWRVQSAHRFEADARIEYKAGGPMTTIQFPGRESQACSRAEYDEFVRKWADDKWRPSIHMPKEAARLFLRVTNVRVERLQDMQPYDIAFEGFRRQRDFVALWDSTIKKPDLPRYGWAANPWVWVIEFERIGKEEAVKMEREILFHGA